MSVGFAAIVVLFWLAVEVSAPLAEPIAIYEYARPIGVVRDVRDSWWRLGHLPPVARIEALETEAGHAQFISLIRETAGNCGGLGNILVLASRRSPHAEPAGYLLQRGRYLLSPRRPTIAYDHKDLTALLREKAQVAALIVHDAVAPSDVAGRVVYTNGSRFMVVCDPRAPA